MVVYRRRRDGRPIRLAGLRILSVYGRPGQGFGPDGRPIRLAVHGELSDSGRPGRERHPIRCVGYCTLIGNNSHSCHVLFVSLSVFFR